MHISQEVSLFSLPLFRQQGADDEEKRKSWRRCVQTLRKLECERLGETDSCSEDPAWLQRSVF